MIRLTPLSAATLPEFSEFLARDDFGGCFCAVWTSFGPDWGERCADPARPNLCEARRRVAAGEHLGYLVHEGDALVAWTGAGPRSGFPLLDTKLGSRLTQAAPEVWSVGCLSIATAHRGRGLSAEILRALLAEAQGQGARVVEAYPVRPWDEPRSYRGAISTYASLGFEASAEESDGETTVVVMTWRAP